mmetsp:Transcript_4837/g.8795  ORF Transcript_4837/g.8795 Transcript_4837/m.8795 type:complete len:225 (-) Transcript_4837:1910-2584(-)
MMICAGRRATQAATNARVAVENVGDESPVGTEACIGSLDQLFFVLGPRDVVAGRRLVEEFLGPVLGDSSVLVRHHFGREEAVCVHSADILDLVVRFSRPWAAVFFVGCVLRVVGPPESPPLELSENGQRHPDGERRRVHIVHPALAVGRVDESLNDSLVLPVTSRRQHPLDALVGGEHAPVQFGRVLAILLPPGKLQRREDLGVVHEPKLLYVRDARPEALAAF